MSASRQITGSQSALVPYYTSVKGKCAYDPSHSLEEKTLLKCSVCKTAFYCGISCQSIDWPKHKQVCAILVKESSPTNSPPTPFAPNPTVSLLDKIGEDLRRIAIQTIQEIARQNQTRMQGYLEDPHLLNEGIFTPLQYYKAHVDLGRQEHLHWLDKNTIGVPLNSRSGPLFNGYLPSPTFHRLLHRWERPEDLVKYQRFGFAANSSISATYALDALLKGPSLLESATACQAAYWKAIQGVLGGKFDPLFNGSCNNLLLLRMSEIGAEEYTQKNPLNGLITTTISPSHKAKPGQFLYFLNISAYSLIHSFFDDGMGYATLCIGEKEGAPLFTTLGLNAEGEGSEEIAQRLFDRFKKEPLQGFASGSPLLDRIFYQNDPMKNPRSNVAPLIDDSTLKQIDEYLKFTARVQTVSDSFEEFKKRGGGKMSPFVKEFNVERIAMLASSKSTREAEALLARWKQEKQADVSF